MEWPRDSVERCVFENWGLREGVRSRDGDGEGDECEHVWFHGVFCSAESDFCWILYRQRMVIVQWQERPFRESAKAEEGPMKSDASPQGNRFSIPLRR